MVYPYVLSIELGDARTGIGEAIIGNSPLKS